MYAITTTRRFLRQLFRRHALRFAARGQGTVEYVGIVLAIGALLFALSGQIGEQGDGIAKKVGTAVTKAIDETLKS